MGKKASSKQMWSTERSPLGDGAVMLSDPDRSACLDNMQKTSGAPGIYACHGGGTQQWTMRNGKIQSAYIGFEGGQEVCLGFTPQVGVAPCVKDDVNFQWHQDGDLFRSKAATDYCITRTNEGNVVLRHCRTPSPDMRWSFKK